MPNKALMTSTANFYQCEVNYLYWDMQIISRTACPFNCSWFCQINPGSLSRTSWTSVEGPQSTMLDCQGVPQSSSMECFGKIRRKVLHCHNRLSQFIFNLRRSFSHSCPAVVLSFLFNQLLLYFINKVSNAACPG